MTGPPPKNFFFSRLGPPIPRYAVPSCAAPWGRPHFAHRWRQHAGRLSRSLPPSIIYAARSAIETAAAATAPGVRTAHLAASMYPANIVRFYGDVMAAGSSGIRDPAWRQIAGIPCHTLRDRGWSCRVRMRRGTGVLERSGAFSPHVWKGFFLSGHHGRWERLSLRTPGKDPHGNQAPGTSQGNLAENVPWIKFVEGYADGGRLMATGIPMAAKPSVTPVCLAGLERGRRSSNATGDCRLPLVRQDCREGATIAALSTTDRRGLIQFTGYCLPNGRNGTTPCSFVSIWP